MNFIVANEKHIKEIFDIANHFDIDNHNQDDRGFLVSSYTLAEYKKFLQDPNQIIYVSVNKDNKVEGFIYGYYVPYGKTSVSLDTIQEMANANDFIVKQICVHPSSPKGTGTFLMTTLFKLIDGNLYLAIVTDPMNISSLIFHKKIGFVEVKRIIENDSRERLIMVRYKNQELESFSRIMLSQYDTAIDLYKHEDQLTWTKFNFSILTNGAILSILIPSLNSSFNKSLFVFLVLVVILINIGYIFTIGMGRIYLQKRKNDAILIEHKLKYLGMMYVVKPDEDSKSLYTRILNSSFTKYVQFIIPCLFIIGWIVVLVLNV